MILAANLRRARRSGTFGHSAKRPAAAAALFGREPEILVRFTFIPDPTHALDRNQNRR